MSGTKPSVTVVIASVNRPTELVQCVNSVLDQIQPYDELLVVLRTVDGESREALQPFGDRLRIVDVARQGQVAALNAGRAQARGTVISFVDDDAQPHPDWLHRIRTWFERNPHLGAVGGRDIVHIDGRIVNGVARHVGRVSWWGRPVGRHHLEAPRQEVQFLKGANMSFRRDLLAPFDERLWGTGAQVCNDLEASLSVHRRGWSVIYDPLVAVDHFPAKRLAGDERGALSLGSECAQEHNQLYVLLRHQPRWRAPIIAAYAILVGYRQSPGVALSFMQLVHTHEDARGNVKRLAALTRARLRAIQTWRSSTRPKG